MPQNRLLDPDEIPWAAITTVVLVALAVRLLLLFGLDAYEIPEDWDFGYETGRIAASLAEGEGFSSPFRRPTGPTAWLAPAYPALLAGFFALFGVYSTPSAISILVFNSVVSALTCFAVFLLANRAFDRMTGVLAAVVFALYPPAVWHSVNTIWDTSLLALLVVLLALGIYRVGDRGSLSWAGGYGLLLGLAAWVNPIALSLVPVVWWWIWRRTKARRARKLEMALLVPLLALLAVAPWMVRNYHLFGKPYLRSNLGLELHLGNSEAAWRHHQEGDLGAPWLRGHPSVVSRELDRFIEVGEASYVEAAMARAVSFIREHPVEFLVLTLDRIYVFWLSDLGTRNEWAGNLDLSISLTWARVACHLIPLPFLLVGLVAAHRERRPISPMLGVFLFLPLIYYVTHVSERYRFPIEPLIVVLGSYGFLQIINWLGTRRN